jgi:hypothetical protein
MKFDGLSLRNMLPLVCTSLKFQDYIRFINGTFINIHKSWNNDIHKSWFNKHKKIYYMNNMVVLNYHKLFTLLIPSMTWTSCVSQIYTKIGIEFFYIEMSIVNIYWMTQVIWVKNVCDVMAWEVWTCP